MTLLLAFRSVRKTNSSDFIILAVIASIKASTGAFCSAARYYCSACMFGGFIAKGIVPYVYCVFATREGYGETARMHLL